MSENAAKQSAGTEGAASPRESDVLGPATTHGVPEPHFVSRVPRVLARVPDLESADSGAADQPAPADRGRRVLTSGLSMLVLSGGGALLLLAALGLPFLLDGADPADLESNGEMPTWPLESPAPSAPLAPAWQGTAENEPAWQVPGAAPQYSFEVPATPDWPESAQSANGAEPSAPGSWDNPLPASPWPSLPAAQTWDNRPAAPVEGGAAGPAASWQGQAQAPSWPAPRYGASGQEGAPFAGSGVIPPTAAAVDPWQTAPPTGTYGTPQTARSNTPTAHRSAPESPYPAPAGRDFYLPPDTYRPPQADTNRPTATADPGWSATPAGYPRTVPAPEAERSEYPPTSYPPTGYQRTADPPTSYPPTPYAPSTYPGTTYPVAGQSAGGYPPAAAPREQSPISGHAPTAPWYRATQDSSYSPPPEARCQQPGGARLHGIEKPTESNAYEQYRSRLY